MRKFLTSGWLTRALAFALLMSISCGGGSCGGGAGGCSGCGGGTYVYPYNEPSRPDAIVQDDAVRVRITQDFLDFLRPQLPTLIRSQFGNQTGGMYIDANNILHIPIPDQDLFDIGVAEARMRNAEALLFLDDLANRVDLQFTPPTGMRLTISNLRLGIQLKLKEDVAGTTSSCPIIGDLGPVNGNVPHAAEISIDAVIDPGVGPRPDYPLDIDVTVSDIALNDLDVEVASSSVYCQEPECQDCLVEVFGNCLDPVGRCGECDIFCGGLTDGLLSLVGALIDLVKPLLNQILQPVVQGILGNVLNNLNGSSAKLESQFKVADLAGIAALQRAGAIGVLVAPSPGVHFPVVDRGTGNGMEITINAGAEGELADCVDVTDPFVSAPGPVPVLAGADKMGRPYHLGMTLASTYLNQIFYAVHRSGTLCLKLGSEDVRELTGGAFTLNASLLSLLASDISQLATDRAPVIVELKPRQAGTVELGTGEQTGMDAMGNPTYDWLIKLRLQDLGIAFHVLMQDRYVRVFEVTADVFVGLNINVLPDNKLQVNLGELRIDDFQQDFNEILPNADFAMVLPTLLDLALGAFLNQALTFDLDLTTSLSDALNGAPIFMRINEIFRDGIQQDYLTLNLTFSDNPAFSLTAAADTRARLHPMDNGLLDRTLEGPTRPTGRVRLEVGEGLLYTDAHALEYQLRVDGGLWQIWRPAREDGTLYVEDARLRMPGRHAVEVRARNIGDYQSLDPTPVELTAVVDPFAPQLAVSLGDEAVEVSVEDPESGDASTVLLSARADDGEWFDVPVYAMDEAGNGVAEVPLARISDARAITFQAKDLSGNTSPPARLRLGLGVDTDTVDAKPKTQKCSCHEVPGVPHGHDEWTLMMLGLFAGALVYRARNRR
ncbi:MAG: hypothetical protein IPG45_29275 [Deltaproteobacteria bacterium]|nr:hypothetical protein [Deltaproteobacteria bacterium]